MTARRAWSRSRTGGTVLPRTRESWRSRQLAMMLALRNIKVRYTQTILGSAWIIVQPILLTGALTLVLGGFLHYLPRAPLCALRVRRHRPLSAFTRLLNDTAISLANSGGIILKGLFSTHPHPERVSLHGGSLFPAGSMAPSFLRSLPIAPFRVGRSCSRPCLFLLSLILHSARACG